MTDIGSLVQIMYDKNGFDGKFGIEFFHQWSDELISLDFSDLLICVMRYPYEFSVDFILSTPFLWEKKGGAIWKDILTVAPRPDTRKSIDIRNGAFSDIVFLSSYVGVDALSYILKSDGITTVERASLVAYFKKNRYSLAPSDLNDEELDGIHHVEKSILVQLREDLIFNFGFEEVKFSECDVFEYVERQIAKYEL